MNFEISEALQQQYKIKKLEFQIQQLHLKSNEYLTIKTNDGNIKGVKRRTIYDDPYYSFEHIPYAQPPVGELRFRAPKPISPWKGVRDCTHYGPKPVQRDIISGQVEGVEDCLYLNVYTNNLVPNKPQPVMIWLYGGGFKLGEATREWYGPDYFMKKGVVLVTVQYRLGALGFLGLKDSTLLIPGNAGLKDQLMAIKWVKRNCASFGGNPECITLFGESAGAVATHALMLSEQAKGLFQRVILQSGTALMDWLDFGSVAPVLPLAQAAGYTGEENDQSVLNFLMNCTAEQIIDAEKQCPTLSFAPCVETYLTQHTVLSRPFVELLPNAWGNTVPLLIGSTSNEGLFCVPFVVKMPQMIEMQMKTCESFVPKNAVADRNGSELKDKASKLRQLHVEGEKATASEYFEIFSFSNFWHPIQKTIDARLQQSKKATTFLYRFDFETEKLIQGFRFIRTDLKLDEEVHGVAHGDELPFLFSSAFASPMEKQSREYRTIERMIGLWTQFAETGNPNGAKIEGMKDIKWEPLRQQSSADDSVRWKCLNIGDELKFTDLPEMSKLSVWKSLYEPSSVENKSEGENLSVPEKSSI